MISIQIYYSLAICFIFCQKTLFRKKSLFNIHSVLWFQFVSNKYSVYEYYVNVRRVCALIVGQFFKYSPNIRNKQLIFIIIIIIHTIINFILKSFVIFGGIIVCIYCTVFIYIDSISRQTQLIEYFLQSIKSNPDIL